MKRRLTSPRTAENCKSFIRQNVDRFSLNFGVPAMTGWTKLGWFCLSYRDGKTRRHPIFNRAFGRISRRGGRTVVTYRTYKGLTDPIGFFFLLAMAACFMIAVAGRESLVIPLAETAEAIIGLAVMMAGVTWLSTIVREDGRENERELIGFIERNFGQLPPDDV
ncbi:hypothetical protein [Cohnella sp. GCM10027633]|uniref:hypothetical protein n=1 Tax=unclassified Cohnella TaxID=2636738 RepID=UPI0036437561